MFRSSLALLISAAVHGHAHADTIYLCEAYSGGMFWSSVTCGQRQAVITRTVSVPDGMPWDQKVALGEAARARGAALIAMPAGRVAQPQAVTQPQAVNQQASRQAVCNGLRDSIANIDSQMRQPQSGQTMNWLKDQRRHLSDQRYRLGC